MRACACTCVLVRVCACACMCMHVRACTCMCGHVRACTCACMCVHVHARACAYMCVRACVCVREHVRACACVHVRACACEHVRASMCVRACACMCEYARACGCMCVTRASQNTNALSKKAWANASKLPPQKVVHTYVLSCDPTSHYSIGLYRDVWIAAIASSRKSLATQTAAICVRFHGRQVRHVYVTMQITFLARKSALIYRRGLRQRVASLTIDCNGESAIRAYSINPVTFRT